MTRRPAKHCDICGHGRAKKVGIWVAHTGCLQSLIAAMSEAPRWFLSALERLAAGEPEREVMADYGYTYTEPKR